MTTATITAAELLELAADPVKHALKRLQRAIEREFLSRDSWSIDYSHASIYAHMTEAQLNEVVEEMTKLGFRCTHHYYASHEAYQINVYLQLRTRR